MPKFFILSTKQELKIYIVLRNFTKVTLLLGVTNFLGMTTLKIFFVNSLTISSYLNMGY